MTKINSSSKKGGAYSARERTVTYAPQFNFAVGTTVPLAHLTGPKMLAQRLESANCTVQYISF